MKNIFKIIVIMILFVGVSANADCIMDFMKKDYSKAIQTCNAVAKDAPEYYLSRSTLGLMYYKGFGVNIDYKKSFNYFTQSLKAEHRLSMPMYYLAKQYIDGKGVAKDEFKAIQLLKQATREQDFPPASEYLKKLEEKEKNTSKQNRNLVSISQQMCSKLKGRYKNNNCYNAQGFYINTINKALEFNGVV